jgi:hypothetical protein
MLGCMITSYAVNKDGIGEYQYQFVDFIIDSYKNQDNIQIAAILSQLKNHVQTPLPHVKFIVLQSDNASRFVSQQHVNLQLIKFINAGNDMLTETDIQRAMSFDGGIAGTTTILLDASRLVPLRNDPNSQIKFKAKKGCCSTHEIEWTTTETRIYQLSGITTPEIISSATFAMYPILDRNTTVCHSFLSVATPLSISLCTN